LFVAEVNGVHDSCYQDKPEGNSGDTDMTHADNQFQASSVTLSMMVSEAIYRAVVGVERIIRRFARRAL
jgi:hypothetical protein